MSLTARAAWTIERNLAQPLTLGGVAETCGVSPFHLAHAFSDTAGVAVMDYVRGRRLTEAARALAQGAGDILDLALESGYASHEAFSRAFKARFGDTPEGVRRAGGAANLPLVVPLAIPETVGDPVRPLKVEAQGDARIVGLSLRIPLGEAAGVTSLWGRFMPHYEAIPHRVRDIPTGACTDADEDGGFTYLAGLEVSSFSGAPAGLQRLTAPAADYAVFLHEGHVTEIRRTYAAIWDRGLAAAGLTAADAPSLERHCPTFNTNTGFGGIELWIPLAQSGQ